MSELYRRSEIAAGALKSMPITFWLRHRFRKIKLNVYLETRMAIGAHIEPEISRTRCELVPKSSKEYEF